MLRSRRLEPVREVASHAEERAAQALAAGETRLTQARARLTELERYEREYRSALQERTAAGIGIGELRAFQTFIAKLGEAVTQQGLLVGRASEERDTLRERWLEASKRSRAVGKVIEHAAADERRADERREQSDCDERAQRNFAAARAKE
mgnify:CR=1 FL=1